MKNLLGLALLMSSTIASGATCSALLDHKVNSLLGDKEDLCQYAGKVVLVVNTASYCGYTPQYKGLQALNEKYKSRGLVILGLAGQQQGNRGLLRSHLCGQVSDVLEDVRQGAGRLARVRRAGEEDG